MDAWCPLLFILETDFIYNYLHIAQKWTKNQCGKLQSFKIQESCHLAAARRVKLWSLNANLFFNERHQLTKFTWRSTQTIFGRERLTSKVLLQYFWPYRHCIVCKFNKNEQKTQITHTLTRLAELVLTLNTFSFSGEYYRQIGGVAMGSKMGPSYACLLVGYIEEQIRVHYTGFVPQLLKRYIDDVVGCAQCSRHDLEHYIDYVSNFHPALQFTSTISELELPFLDIKLSINSEKLPVSITNNEQLISSMLANTCKLYV